MASGGLDSPSPAEVRLGTARQEIYTPGWAPIADSAGSVFYPVGVEKLSFLPGAAGAFTELWTSSQSIRALTSYYYDGRTWSSDYYEDNIYLDVAQTAYLLHGISTAHMSSYDSMVVSGSDNAAYHRYRLQGQIWSTWEPLGGEIWGAPVITGRPVANHVHVWVRGFYDNALWLNRWNGTWSWTPLGALPAGLVLASDVAAAQRQPTVLGVESVYVDLAVVGSDGNVWRNTYSDATNALTGAWTKVSGGVPPGTAVYAWENPVAVTSSSSSSYDIWVNAWTSAGFLRLYRSTNGGGWTDAPSKSGSDYTIPTPASGPAASFRGGSSGKGTDLAFLDQAGRLEYRSWYTSAPTPVVMNSPDRGMQSTYGPGPTNWGCDATGNDAVRQWENTSLIAPTTIAECSANSVLFSPGNWTPNGLEMLTWVAPITCAQGAGGTVPGCGGTVSPRCAMTPANLWTAAVGYPPGLSFLGTAVGMFGPLGSSDNQIVRLSGSNVGQAPDGSLMLVRQAVITASPNQLPGTGGARRGAEIIYRSNNCGQTWTYKAVLDPCDGALDGGFGCDQTTGGGFDRHEVYASQAVPGRVYLSVGAKDQTVVYMTQNYGDTWTPLVPGGTAGMPRLGAGYMTEIGDTLFAVGTENCSSHNQISVIGLGTQGAAQYIPPCPDREIPIQGSLVSQIGVWGYPALSLVGRYGDNTYLRVVYNAQDVTMTRQLARIAIVRLGGLGGYISVVEESQVPLIAANAGSTLHMAMVDMDRFDLPPEFPANVSMLWWYEGDRVPTPAGGDDWGNVAVRGCVLRDLSTTCTPMDLALNANFQRRTWTGYRRAGDYSKGAFWYDPSEPSGKSLKFLAHWEETPGLVLTPNAAGINYATAPTSVIHSNMVMVAP